MKYKDLQETIDKLNKEIVELKKTLYWKEIEIKDAHEELDQAGVTDISPELGHAFIGHRIQWLKKNDDSKK